MQGLGIFACRRDVWPGFNPRLRGFGGEEGYIHEKFRRAGGPAARGMSRTVKNRGPDYARPAFINKRYPDAI